MHCWERTMFLASFSSSAIFNRLNSQLGHGAILILNILSLMLHCVEVCIYQQTKQGHSHRCVDHKHVLHEEFQECPRHSNRCLSARWGHPCTQSRGVSVDVGDQKNISVHSFNSKEWAYSKPTWHWEGMKSKSYWAVRPRGHRELHIPASRDGSKIPQTQGQKSKGQMWICRWASHQDGNGRMVGQL